MNEIYELRVDPGKWLILILTPDFRRTFSLKNKPCSYSSTGLYINYIGCLEGGWNCEWIGMWQVCIWILLSFTIQQHLISLIKQARRIHERKLENIFMDSEPELV